MQCFSLASVRGYRFPMENLRRCRIVVCGKKWRECIVLCIVLPPFHFSFQYNNQQKESMKTKLDWNASPVVVGGRTAAQAAEFLRSLISGDHSFLDDAYGKMAQALEVFPERQVTVMMGEIIIPERRIWLTLRDEYAPSITEEAMRSRHGEIPPLLTVFSIVDVATEIEMIRMVSNERDSTVHISVQGPFAKKGES